MIPYDVGFYPLIYKGEVSGPGSLIETLINIKNPGGGGESCEGESFNGPVARGTRRQ